MSAVTYLDHAATTPMRVEAVEAMMPYLRDLYANPSGAHRFARRARTAVDDAREVVAAAVGCAPGEVVFNSGGTEGDNTAILGAGHTRAGIAVCPAAEHHAVLAAAEHGAHAVVRTGSSGTVDLDALADALRGADVAVVSVMAVNNEVGTITDLAAVAEVVRAMAPGALLHTDAVQAALWLDLPSVWRSVDALSLSAHKFGGPKGAGVLVQREGSRIGARAVGGGQERERRSGTHNVAGIVASSVALELAQRERSTEVPRVAALRDRLVDTVTGQVDGVVETVDRAHKVAGSAHLCIEGVENEALLYLLDEADVCASAASACASGAMEPSHVLAAMGVRRELATGAVRLTLGHDSTDADVDRAAAVLVDAIGRLRRGRR